jgi:hypothetical protein
MGQAGIEGEEIAMDTTGFIEPDDDLKLWSWQYNKASELGKSLNDVRLMAAIDRKICDPHGDEYRRQVNGSWNNHV